jgi:hypothetical protein
MKQGSWGVLLLLFCCTCLAESNLKPQVTMSMDVSGYDERNSTIIKIVLGPGAMTAVRIYSEPSHTLLGVIVDSASMPDPAGTDWWKSTIGPLSPRAQLARLPLKEGVSIGLQTNLRPPTDEGLDIYVLGIWARGEEKDDLLVHFGGGRVFQFTASSVLDPVTLRPLFLGCCGDSSGGCGGSCVNCKQNETLWCCRQDDWGCSGACSRIYARCSPCPAC